MSNYTNIGATPPISPIMYGSNLSFYPSNVATILQITTDNLNYPTEFGNGIRLGLNGPQIITFPVVSVVSGTGLKGPNNSPIGSLALDSSYYASGWTAPISDIWHKYRNTQYDWAPLQQTYYVIGYGTSGGPLIANNTLTFISFYSVQNSMGQVFSGYGPFNENSGSQTVYTNGYFVQVPFDSIYLAWVTVGLEADIVANRFDFYTSFYVNGAEVSRGLNNNYECNATGGQRISQMTTLLKLNKGDIVSFAAYQNSGATKTISDAYSTACGIVNLGTIV